MARTETKLELEGTWEEVLSHSRELAGRRVRVVALPPENEKPEGDDGLSPDQRAMLDVLEEWKQDPLTPDEIEALEEFEAFRERHPIPFRAWDPEL